MAREVLPAVVELQVSSAAQQGTGYGVALRSDGYILTNAHVVEGTTRITVTLQSGERVDTELVGSDATDDPAPADQPDSQATPSRRKGSSKVDPRECRISQRQPSLEEAPP